MDDWRTRLTAQLLDPAPRAASGAPAPALSASTTMEIAFGKARSELTYVLELGRAHHLPITGSIAGDEIWIRLGEARLAFTFDRATPSVAVAISDRDAITLACTGAAVTANGDPIDLDAFVRDAVDTIVRAWKKPAATPTGANENAEKE